MSTQTNTGNIAYRLWDDHDVLRLKLEKTVGVVLALGQSLSTVDKLSASESEFVLRVDWMQTVPSEHFESVFRDPRAYHWARVAFDLVAAVHYGAELSTGTQQHLDELGIDDLVVALEYHLNQFNLFVISLAIHCGVSVSVSPTRVNVPDKLPATGWSFSCDQSVELLGVEGDRLRVRIGGNPCEYQLPDRTTTYSSGLTIHLGCEIETEQGKLVLQPHTFNVPGLVDIRSAAAADVDAQTKVAETLESTLAMIERHAPETYCQLTTYMKVIAFTPASAGGVYNTSCSRLPGASIFTEPPNRLVLADDLIHEFYHNRLFALEEQVDFFDTSPISSETATTYYSPWRYDPRPIYGLFHAAYVFERVHQFWVSTLENEALRGMDLVYAKSRAAKLCQQLQLTLPQLLCWAPFSTEGRQICEAIADSLTKDAARAESIGITGDVGAVKIRPDGIFSHLLDSDNIPISVNAELKKHVATYDVNSRARQIVEDHFEQYSDFAAVIAEILV